LLSYGVLSKLSVEAITSLRSHNLKQHKGHPINKFKHDIINQPCTMIHTSD